MGSASRHSGVTLIEVAVSTALVGFVLVAALETLGGAMRMTRQTRDGVDANTLAETLMAEVIALPYSDPEGAASALGLEADEVVSSSDRSTYDDVDDFHGWLQSPPEDRDGTPIPGYTGWSRKVEISYLHAEPVGSKLGASTRDLGLKQVRITVVNPQGAPTELFAIRGPYGPNEAPAPFDATRVTAFRAEVSVGGGATVRKSVALKNLAEAP
ncbi:hypothetical protein MalM25_19770 [Planctomycetes bacterium MalM25]|nr:hypothetical protein MalM25_19770 [Planctomycetes bacterium MalM25]